jgi:hypothetical protein
MTRDRLPGTWADDLDALSFVAKDAVLVLDDLSPSAAGLLLRGTAARRSRATGPRRPPKPPRGLIIATGPDVPRGRPITSRLCVVPIDHETVRSPRLSACQEDAAGGRYAAAMAGYLAWLAPRYADIRAGLDTERADLRDPSARAPEIAAGLLLGLRYLLRFAEEVGAIDARERSALWDRSRAAVRTVVGWQDQWSRPGDPVDPVARFPEDVAAVLGNGRGHVTMEDGSRPYGPRPTPGERSSAGWSGRCCASTRTPRSRPSWTWPGSGVRRTR